MGILSLLERLYSLEVLVGPGDGDAPAPRARLTRAWPREGGHLLLEYRTSAGTLLAGQWFADPARARQVGQETARGLPAGRVTVRNGVVIQAGGADRRLVGLVGLLTEPGAELVSHRPERRAVVRLTGPAGPRYAKVVPPARAPTVVACMRRAQEVGVFTTPSLVAGPTDDGVTVWSALPGRSLFDLLASDRLAAVAGAAGAALRALHEAPLGAYLPYHGPAEERGLVARWLARASEHEAPGALAAAARLAAASLRSLPASGLVPVHRDCHDKQIFATGSGRIGVLDFDTLALGDPALDVANVLVHLELRVLQERCPAPRADAAAAALIEAYEPEQALRDRLSAYAAATRVRLACLYRFRPSWTHLADPLTDRLTAPLPGVSAAAR